MPDLKWNDDADRVLRQRANEFTKPDGEVDWPSVLVHLPGRTKGSAESRLYRLTHDKLSNPTDEDDDQPSFQKLFEYLRDRERSLKQISNHFNVSPKTIEYKIAGMDEKGYRLSISREHYSVTTSTVPQVNPPAISIQDLMGKHFCIAVASDIHATSRHSQPTSLNRFIKFAYEEYNVRHVMVPGDLTDGVYVYRGHIDSLIPQARPMTRDRSWMTAEAAAQLADIYLPKYDGLTYFMMGGNHDRSLITNSGMDPIRMACSKRDDFHYGGYDVWSIRLTERSYVRLVHPSGGVPYARSYHAQKAIENLAFEALRKAMAEDMPPMISIMIMGHYHLTNHTPEPPLHGILAGCFQGQTEYLKQKRLTPHIAGIIIEMRIDDRGKPWLISHTPVPFEEIEDDWKNWPVPDVVDPSYIPDNLDVLFKGIAEPPLPEPPAIPPAEATTTSP